MKPSEITEEYMAGYLRLDMLEETEQREIATHCPLPRNM